MFHNYKLPNYIILAYLIFPIKIAFIDNFGIHSTLYHLIKIMDINNYQMQELHSYNMIQMKIFQINREIKSLYYIGDKLQLSNDIIIEICKFIQ